MPEYAGLLFVGDPHLRSRNPQGRMDDYPAASLEKFRWSLAYAREERLLPCILGDFFEEDFERNLGLIGDLCGALSSSLVLAIFGNHDTKEKTLTDRSALMVPVKAGLLQLVSESAYWEGLVAGRRVIVGGSSYGSVLPGRFPPGYGADVRTFWMTHHNILFQAGDGDTTPYQIDGVDYVVNGHLHNPRDSVQAYKTTWFNPGALTRSRRSDVWAPRLLRFDGEGDRFVPSYVSVPHKPYEEVFGAAPERIDEQQEADFGSEFVRGLKALTRRGGLHGEGLTHYLEQNRAQFEPDVFQEIDSLRLEVLNSEQ